MRSVNVNSHQVWDEDSRAEQLQVSSAYSLSCMQQILLLPGAVQTFHSLTVRSRWTRNEVALVYKVSLPIWHLKEGKDMLLVLKYAL